MKYGVIKSSLVALHKAPSEKSEMINQLLFGEHFIIHRTLQNWMFVESVFDGYSGWMNKLSFLPLGNDQLPSFETGKSVIVPRLNRATILQEKKSHVHLMPGSFLPSFDPGSGQFRIGDQLYMLISPIDTGIIKRDRKHITDTGLSFLNSPYLWGGRSPFGIDSPGLMQVTGKIHGIFLPREASQQVTMGLTVNFSEEAIPGDLAFFDDEEGGITHAGLVVGKGRILHASGGVRIDTIDHQGIFREDTGEYTHRLRVIKNIIDQERT